MAIERLVTSGTFNLDGGSWEVDNNVWLVGDDDEVVIVDAAHDPDAILAAVRDRRVTAIVLTHGHDDHIGAAGVLADATGAPVWLHRDDRMLWDTVYPDRSPDGELVDGQTFVVGGHTIRVLHTPGHAPGAVCLYDAEHGALFSGDTLFNGGPGATGRSYSDFPTIMNSLETKVFGVLPDDTVFHPGHGDNGILAEERPHLEEWRERGW